MNGDSSCQFNAIEKFRDLGERYGSVHGNGGSSRSFWLRSFDWVVSFAIFLELFFRSELLDFRWVEFVSLGVMAFVKPRAEHMN